MTSHDSNTRFVKPVLFNIIIVALSLSGLFRTAAAEQLPLVNGVSFDGVTISWNVLDAATGYNVYRDFRYVATVTVGTEYIPEAVGEYRVAAYDDNGNFSPLDVIESEVVPTSNIAIVDFFDDILEPPNNLSGTVYSTTAGEVFWNRENSRTLKYSVSLNGVEIGTSSGTSFWMNSLIPNTQNFVSVAAVNQTGLTSEPITLLFDTALSPLPASAVVTDPDNPDSVLSAPQNARIEVYSSTAAELFWDRAPLDQQVLVTQIYRDNELIWVGDGISFFDDTREPATSYTYELVAMNADGSLSPSTYINPGPFVAPDDGDADSIARTLLEGISEASSSNPHVRWFPLIQSILDEELPDDVVEVSSEDNFDESLEDVVTSKLYQCDDGTLAVDKTSGSSVTADFAFNDCRINKILFSGFVFVFSDGETYENVEYFDFLIFEEDGDVDVNGSVTVRRPEGGDRVGITYSDFSYYEIGNLVDETGLDTSVLLNQTIVYDLDNAPFPSTFTTAMTVSAPWTQGRFLDVTTVDTFKASESSGRNYVTGVMFVESANGGKLFFNADTGEDDTWYAEVFDNNGSEGVVGQWSESIQFPCIVLNGECD